MSLFVTRGEARPILEFVPPSGEPGGIYLAHVTRRHTKDSHLPTAATDLLFTTENLDNKADIILPVLELAGKALKIKGGALFKKDKFVGYIDEYAIQGARYIRGVEKDAIVTAPDPDRPGEFIVFEIFRHDTKIKPHVDGDNIYFTLDIAMRGNIDEVSDRNEYDTMNTEVLRRAQTLIAEEVKRNIMYGLQKTQELDTDILFFGKLLKAEEPKTWARVKDNWDEIFPTVPLIVSVNVSIINVGEHK
jgi:Ger(x)C family germination protein